MVVFHGTTDCTDLDVARDIVLKRGYVLVYPDQWLALKVRQAEVMAFSKV